MITTRLLKYFAFIDLANCYLAPAMYAMLCWVSLIFGRFKNNSEQNQMSDIGD